MKAEQRHPSSLLGFLPGLWLQARQEGGTWIWGTRSVAGDRCRLWEGAGISLAKFIQTDREPDPTESARCVGAPSRLQGWREGVRRDPEGGVGAPVTCRSLGAIFQVVHSDLALALSLWS